MNYTLRNLGDGFAMFDGAELIKDYVSEDYLVMSTYAMILTAQMLRVCRTCPAPIARWPHTPATCSTTSSPTAQAASPFCKFIFPVKRRTRKVLRTFGFALSIIVFPRESYKQKSHLSFLRWL